MHNTGEFKLSSREFEKLYSLIMDRTGIYLTEDKKALVYVRLARRLRALRLSTFSDYYDYLSSNSHQELEHLTNAVTTNLTSFFRENHHFEFLRTQFVPGLLKDRLNNRRIRIWSAGCSTGQEAYSIAMTLHDCIPNSSVWDIKIIATDINSEVLKTGKSGVYSRSSVKDLDEQLLKSHFLRSLDGESVKVKNHLKSMVEFRMVNLLSPWNFEFEFDIVFCRNVIIYFNTETQKGLLERFHSVLKKNGYLIVGHSEHINRLTNLYKLVGKTIHLREGECV